MCTENNFVSPWLQAFTRPLAANAQRSGGRMCNSTCAPEIQFKRKTAKLLSRTERSDNISFSFTDENILHVEVETSPLSFYRK